MRIDVHIERLILDGLPVTSLEAPQVERALETELAALLGVGGLSAELRYGAAVPSVRAGAIPLTRAMRPATLGQSIARAVHSGIACDVGSAPRRGNPQRGSKR